MPAPELAQFRQDPYQIEPDPQRPGRYCVRGLPLFCTNRRSHKGGTVEFTDADLDKAVQVHANLDRIGHSPAWFKGHHDLSKPNEDRPRLGKLRAVFKDSLEVMGPGDVEPKRLPTLFGDWCDISPEVAREMVDGKLDYRSVEIKPGECRIAGVAVSDTVPPWFKFPNPGFTAAPGVQFAEMTAGDDAVGSVGVYAEGDDAVLLYHDPMRFTAPREVLSVKRPERSVQYMSRTSVLEDIWMQVSAVDDSVTPDQVAASAEGHTGVLDRVLASGDPRDFHTLLKLVQIDLTGVRPGPYIPGGVVGFSDTHAERSVQYAEVIFVRTYTTAGGGAVELYRNALMDRFDLLDADTGQRLLWNVTRAEVDAELGRLGAQAYKDNAMPLTYADDINVADVADALKAAESAGEDGCTVIAPGGAKLKVAKVGDMYMLDGAKGTHTWFVDQLAAKLPGMTAAFRERLRYMDEDEAKPEAEAKPEDEAASPAAAADSQEQPEQEKAPEPEINDKEAAEMAPEEVLAKVEELMQKLATVKAAIEAKVAGGEEAGKEGEKPADEAAPATGVPVQAAEGGATVQYMDDTQRREVVDAVKSKVGPNVAAILDSALRSPALSAGILGAMASGGVGLGLALTGIGVPAAVASIAASALMSAWGGAALTDGFDYSETHQYDELAKVSSLQAALDVANEKLASVEREKRLEQFRADLRQGHYVADWDRVRRLVEPFADEPAQFAEHCAHVKSMLTRRPGPDTGPSPRGAASHATGNAEVDAVLAQFSEHAAALRPAVVEYFAERDRGAAWATKTDPKTFAKTYIRDNHLNGAARAAK